MSLQENTSLVTPRGIYEGAFKRIIRHASKLPGYVTYTRSCSLLLATVLDPRISEKYSCLECGI